MKKLICLTLLLVAFCSFTSCSNKTAEINTTPEPFKLIIYEEDSKGNVIHKVLYNTETGVYHEYRYYYEYFPNTGYNNLKQVEYCTYTEDGTIISSEVQE